MAFTLTTAITEVRSLINETTASYWDDGELERWIQQGCLDWCEKTLLLSYTDTITLSTNVYTYQSSFSSYLQNSIRVLHAEYKNKALKRLSYEKLRGHNKMVLATDSDPKYFYDKYNNGNFTLYIASTPSASQNGQDVSVLLAGLSDDITEIPYEYQPHIFNYAASKAKMKERQWQEAQLLWQIYLNNISFARDDKLMVPGLTDQHFKEN